MENIIAYYLALNGLSEGGHKTKEVQHHEEKPVEVKPKEEPKKEEPKKEEPKKEEDEIDLFGDG
jgi:hypothetical protein